MAGTVMAVMYMFTTFASAADVKEVKDQIQNVEVRLIKADIRDVRYQLRRDPDNDDLIEELEELIDDLCLLKPDDRECR